MMPGLAGKVAIVTGAAALLGRAMVQAFCDSGTRVVAADTDIRRGQSLADELGPACSFIACDVTIDLDLDHVVTHAKERFGRIDFVVNNAVSYLDDGMDASRDQWLRLLNVNLVSAAMLVQKTAEELRLRRGAVVNLGSVGGKFGAAGRALYPASKAALLQLTRNQAADLAPYGARVNSVSPGWTWSDALSTMASGDQALADRVAAQTHPLGRAGTPHDVAQSVLFLCSDAAQFITGTDMAVDGGFSMLGPDQGRSARDWFDEYGPA